MTEPATATGGVSRPVVVAALATAVGAIPAVVGMSYDSVPTGTVYGLGWPAFGIVAALLLDRDPVSRLGRCLAALAVLPTLVAVTASADPAMFWSRLERWWEWLGPAPVIATFAVLAWGIGLGADRMSRRRLCWLVVWSGVVVASVFGASAGAGPRAAATVTTLGLWGMAALVYRLVMLRELRPIDEPLVDGAIGLAVLLFGAGIGTLIRVAALHARLPGPDTSGVVAAIVAAALALPGGLWLRRLFVDRRYGPGTLSAADVAQITADIHRQTDVRELLGKAATMVAAASGLRPVTIVLGPDAPDRRDGGMPYPLIVGGDRVGTLVLEPRHPQGLELRQERVVANLLPTVSLVAKAVSLAVEADHFRQDLARERDAERARILGDLHDGIGPMLVGMSMRVGAELRHRPTPTLQALADELASCRGDLRRIVSGLTPSVLDDGDLTAALRRLVDSFAGQGPAVTLESALPESLAPEIAVAVYRSIAEGVTNALRHAFAGHVTVRARTGTHGTVLVQVHDDGSGGPIVPGVGLSSLRSRAEKLGGSLSLTTGRDQGTRLDLELPTRGRMP